MSFYSQAELQSAEAFERVSDFIGPAVYRRASLPLISKRFKYTTLLRSANR